MKTDEEEDFKEPIGFRQAIEALETFKFHEEQQNTGNLRLLQELWKHSKVILKRRIDGAEHRSITSYFYIAESPTLLCTWYVRTGVRIFQPYPVITNTSLSRTILREKLDRYSEGLL